MIKGTFTQRGLRIEQAAFPASGHGHPDRGAQSLPQWAGSDLHADGVPVLGMAGRLGTPGAQLFDVLQFQPVAGQEQLQIQRQTGVAGREHKPVPAGPGRIGGIVP